MRASCIQIKPDRNQIPGGTYSIAPFIIHQQMFLEIDLKLKRYLTECAFVKFDWHKTFIIGNIADRQGHDVMSHHG